MGVNLAAMAVGARLFCQTTASLWQLPLPFLPAVTLKIILPGTLGPGPNLALIYKKNALPRKTKTARMTVGPASMY